MNKKFVFVPPRVAPPMYCEVFVSYLKRYDPKLKRSVKTDERFIEVVPTWPA